MSKNKFSADHNDKSVEEILQERAESYGSYDANVKARVVIVDTLSNLYAEKYNISMNPGLKMMMLDLVIKLCRIATGPEHADSYTDLQGYAELMKDSCVKQVDPF